MKERLFYVFMAFVCLAFLLMGYYHWFKMPCEDIKQWNLQTPGRCL